MKLRSILAAVSIAAGSTLTIAISPVSAAGASGFTCTGTLASPGSVPAGTYASLTMPAGSLCQVVGDVTVTSPVNIGSGAGLAVGAGSLTIWGPVSISSQGVLASFDNATPIHIGGPVWVGQDAALIVGTETPGGARTNSISGPVTGNGESSVQIHNATVSGPVQLTGGGGQNAIVDALSGGFPGNFNDLEDNDIGGPVSVTGYHGVWSGVIRDIIRGPFTFSNNVQSPPDEFDIGSNTIYGLATCNDNSPVPNMGHSPGRPSVVFGPIGGDQAATCTSAAAP
jgi:hypothetical protein